MPQVVKADVGEPGVLQELLMEVYHRVRVVHFPGDRGGEQVGAVRVLIMLLDQQVNRRLRNRY